jgi:secreted trypsin-like serine protease
VRGNWQSVRAANGRVLPLVLLALAMAAPTASASHGGVLVPPGRGSALVYFQWTAKNVLGDCSGVLIAQRAVLTAAHCVRSTQFGRHKVAEVRIGNPRGRTVRVPVLRVRPHPGFAPRHPERGNDLAVLVLARGAGRAGLAIVASTTEPVQGTRVEVLGFGVTSAGQPPNAARRPRVVELEVLSPFNCATGSVEAFDATRWCAASPTAATCAGDSGGPAVLRLAGGREVIVGLVSFAVEQVSCRSAVSVLTRVAAFRPWIRTAVKP